MQNLRLISHIQQATKKAFHNTWKALYVHLLG